MKHLFISVFLLLTVIGIIATDSYFVLKKTNEITDFLDGISVGQNDFDSSENIEKIEKLTKLWKDSKFLFDASINRELFDIAEENFINVLEYAEVSSFPEYKRSIGELSDTLGRIADTSRITFESIF